MKKNSIKEQIKRISHSPGVYIFRDISREILYVGKATDLRSRVSSYFRASQKEDRLIHSVINRVADIEARETDSVLEALILEAHLIKKHQPIFNVLGKDDKSFSYFVITKEKFPRVIVLRKTELESSEETKRGKVFGPYTSKRQMEAALKIMRKIFPFHASSDTSERECFDFQLGKCPGPYAGAITRANYLKNIRGIRMILEGKKRNLIRKMEKEMEDFSKKENFEKAAEWRNKVFALRHIQDTALILRDENFKFQISNFQSSSNNQNSNFKIDSKFKILNSKFRIEAYDISNISGSQAVGSMVVFQDRQMDKNEYRRFRIKTISGIDDVGMMAEVLFRRFQNKWKNPNLILLDGGKGHLNMAKKVLQELGLDIPLAAVAKGANRKNVKLETFNIRSMSSDKHQMIKELLSDKLLIKSIMDEAHRFAITYHKKVRRGEFLA